MTTATRSQRLPSALARVPLGAHYPSAVALALLALCPFIVLTTAAALFEQDLMRSLHASAFGVGLASGLSNAAYAFGAVLAADLVQRVPSRWVYIGCEALFVAGSLTALLAGGIVAFSVGRVLQGLATGMLLVAALPPLVTGHGPERLPSTAAVVNLGLFGMVTLGPLVGGIAASAHVWRLLFAVVAALGLAGLVLGVLAFERNDPPVRDRRFDGFAIPLALAAAMLPFIGTSWLSRGSFSSPLFIAPLAAGLACVAWLVANQYRKPHALMPVRPIAHTLPVTGTAAAMVAGAAFTTLLALAEVYLLKVGHRTPLATGGLLASQLAGIAAAAALFKRVLRTRWVPVMALGGLVSIAAAALLLLSLTPATAGTIVPFAGVLLGFGAGAGVAPGLFMAGFSVPSTQLGPTFALVELLRSEAAFLIGPVLLQLALSAGALAGGIHLAIALTLGLTAAAAVVLVGLYLAGGARPHAPNLEAWLAGEASAYDSPPLGARVRGL